MWNIKENVREMIEQAQRFNGQLNEHVGWSVGWKEMMGLKSTWQICIRRKSMSRGKTKEGIFWPKHACGLRGTFSEVIPLLQHVSNCQKRRVSRACLSLSYSLTPWLQRCCMSNRFQYKHWISWHETFHQTEIHLSIYQQTWKIFPYLLLEGMLKISKVDYSDEYSDLLEKYNDFIRITQTGKIV